MNGWIDYLSESPEVLGWTADVQDRILYAGDIVCSSAHFELRLSLLSCGVSETRLVSYSHDWRRIPLTP